MKKVKISELTRVSSLTGAEIVPFAKDGSNGAVTTAKLKEYAQPDLSAITTALGGKVDKVTGKGLSTHDYTDEDKAKLTELPTSTQLTEKIDEGKDSAVLQSLIERAEACGVVYNRKTGFFEHNGIVDLTTAEVSDMLTHVNEIFLPGGAKMAKLKARTNIVTASSFPAGWEIGFVQLDAVCAGNGYIEVLNIGNIAVISGSRLMHFAYACSKLHTIIGEIDLYYLAKPTYLAFARSAKLQEVRLRRAKLPLNFKDCPLLSLASLQYLVNNAANTKAITVTVHPDVYAKIQDETNTEWHALLAAGAAKQITFATTE